MIDFENGGAALISAILATPFDGRFAVYGSLGWAEIRDKSHPENSEGWIATYVVRGKPREVKEYPGAPSARLNLEAFAQRRRGDTILSHQDRSDASDDRRPGGGVRVDTARRMEAGRLSGMR